MGAGIGDGIALGDVLVGVVAVDGVVVEVDRAVIRVTACITTGVAACISGVFVDGDVGKKVVTVRAIDIVIHAEGQVVELAGEEVADIDGVVFPVASAGVVLIDTGDAPVVLRAIELEEGFRAEGVIGVEADAVDFALLGGLEVELNDGVGGNVVIQRSFFPIVTKLVQRLAQILRLSVPRDILMRSVVGGDAGRIEVHDNGIGCKRGLGCDAAQELAVFQSVNPHVPPRRQVAGLLPVSARLGDGLTDTPQFGRHACAPMVPKKIPVQASSSDPLDQKPFVPSDVQLRVSRRAC